MHPCEQIYNIGSSNKIYGNEIGICRITGEKSIGIKFDKWVKDTFNDHSFLLPGNIISNEAIFCFDESSEIIQKKTNKEKPQRFRTYSHIVADNIWYCYTKANKKEIVDIILSKKDQIICLSDSGQKHLLFKHKPKMWQLEDIHIMPDLELFSILHDNFSKLLDLGFSQTEIISGNYFGVRIIKAGVDNWKQHENIIKQYRNYSIFNFTSWLMYAKKQN